GASIVISGAIGGVGKSITKTGAGQLILAANNTYNGSTTVNGGVLTVTSTGSLASTDISVSNVATMNVAGSLAAATALTANGAVNFSNSNKTIASLSGSGAVNLESTALTVGSGS